MIGEIVKGFSQDGRGLHDDLLQRVHRRGARFHGGIPCDLELADHLDGAVRGLGDGRRLPREQGPRRHLGVDGVGLAGGAACTAVAPTVAVQLMQTSPAALSSFSWPHEHRSAA